MALSNLTYILNYLPGTFVIEQDYGRSEARLRDISYLFYPFGVMGQIARSNFPLVRRIYLVHLSISKEAIVYLIHGFVTRGTTDGPTS